MSKKVKDRRDSDFNLLCPGCEGITFNNGPTAGGLCANIRCTGCGARWNWIIGFGEMQPLNEVAEEFVALEAERIAASIVKNVKYAKD